MWNVRNANPARTSSRRGRESGTCLALRSYHVVKNHEESQVKFLTPQRGDAAAAGGGEGKTGRDVEVTWYIGT